MHVKLVYPALIAMGYLQKLKDGYFDQDVGRGQRETYTLTDQLLNYFGFGTGQSIDSKRLFNELIVSTELYSDPEPVKISKRDSSTKLQSVSLPKKTRKLTSITRRLAAINQRLTNHWIDLDLTNSQWEEVHNGWTDKRGEFHAFNFTKRRLYRIYHDDGLLTGGRFYGGWWQEIPKRFRGHIVVDNVDTIECDFSGLHPSILYAEKGEEIPTDAYSPIAGADHRDTIKRCFNAMLNAKKPMAHPPSGVDIRPIGLSWQDLVERITTHHAPIKKHFFTGAGLWLMRKDSDLAEQMMLLFVMRRKICLPVHDSFIVQETDGEQLLQDMSDTFFERYGVAPKIKFTQRGKDKGSNGSEGGHNERYQLHKTVWCAL